MSDPRLCIIIGIIDKDIRFLNDRIARTNNTDQFSGDYCAARYLLGIHKQFIVQCMTRGLPLEVEEDVSDI